MAIRPFANAPHADKTAIATNWLIGVQTGNTPNAVTEMKYLTFEEFTDYIKSNYGAMWNYRGESSSATPTDPEVNDYFVCTGSFTEGGQSFVYGHMYAYNGNTWDDVSLVLNQYVKVESIADNLTTNDSTKVLSAKQGKILNDTLVADVADLQQQIDAISGGITPKGTVATMNDLPAAAGHTGWMYYVTSEGKYKVSDGSTWLDFGTYPIYYFALRSSFPASGALNSLYIAGDEKKIYWWTGTEYISDTAKMAEIDGYYQEMTVGDAEQLVATQAVEDSGTYLFRTSGGSADIGNREDNTIIGGTLGVNQQLYGFSDLSKWVIDGTKTVSADGKLTVVWTPSYTNNGVMQYKAFFVANHKYLVRAEVKNNGDVASRVGVGQPYGTLVNQVWKTISANTTDVITGLLTVTTASGQGYAFNLFGLIGQEYNLTISPMNCIDLTAMFGSEIADYIYTLEQANAGAGVAWFRRYFPKPYYPYNAGSLASVKPSSHDMTGFNQWDEQWEAGRISDTTGNNISGNGIRGKNYIPVIPNTTYYEKLGSYTGGTSMMLCFFDANKNFLSSVEKFGSTTFITPANAYYLRFAIFTSSAVTTYNHDICINLSWSGTRNGEYEPFEKHSYPLDDSTEYRGIPKLDADGNLYFDGDIYKSSGDVTRNYEKKLFPINATWAYRDDGSVYAPYFFIRISSWGIKPVNGVTGKNNVFTDDYVTVARSGLAGADRVIATDGGNDGISELQIKDARYTDVDSFKNHIKDVSIIYELITPTQESVNPFTNPQIVNDWGTEEYVDTRDMPIPVGHNTKYMANLRDKLQHLPMTSENGDGLYAIKQTGKQMELEELSDAVNEVGKEITVGGAEQLVATVYEEDNAPYNFRTSGGSIDIGDRETDEIVGGTLGVNQQFKTSASITHNGITATYDSATGKITLSNSFVGNSYASVFDAIPRVDGHIYLLVCSESTNPNSVLLTVGCLNNNLRTNLTIPLIARSTASTYNTWGVTAPSVGTDLTGITFKFNVIDLTTMFGSTIADYIYSLEQAHTGDGVAWFRRYFPKPYYAYNAGSLESVKAASHDMTGFNQWDEETRLGYYSNDGSFVSYPYALANKNFIKVLPSTNYYIHSDSKNTDRICFYDASENFISYVNLDPNGRGTPFTTPANCYLLNFNLKSDYGTIYNHDVCINLSWSGAHNGEYEPFEKHSYPLDSSTEFRGIPKLDADGNLYYDGDIYKSSGEVTRRFVLVDLTDLVWVYDSSYPNFYAQQDSRFKVHGEIFCMEYNPTNGEYADMPDMSISITSAGGTRIRFKDSGHTGSNLVPANNGKAPWLSGKFILVELAATTQETAAPFTNPQIVNDWGTEEYVDAGVADGTRDFAIPVGHNTKYLANLRDKVQHLPNTADGDGDYVVQQEGRQMRLKSVSNYFPQMAVGTADNLKGKGTVGADFTFRTAGGSADIGSGSARLDKILGNTLMLNQVCSNGNFAENTGWIGNRVSVSISNNKLTATALSTVSGSASIYQQYRPYVSGHIYLACATCTPSVSTRIRIRALGSYFATGTLAANRRETIIGITTPNGNDSIIYVYVNDSETMSEGDTCIIENVMLIDLTQMFGAGNEPTVAEFKALFPLDYYDYTDGFPLNFKGTGLKTVGFNLFDESALGQITGAVKEGDYWKIKSADFLNYFRNNPFFINLLQYKGRMNVTINGYATTGFYPRPQFNYTDGTRSNEGVIGDSPSTWTFLSTDDKVISTISWTYSASGSDKYIYIKNLCLNFSWSGIRNGEYEPYWDSTLPLPITTIKGKASGSDESVVIFPDGMRSAGSARDELTAKKGVARIGAYTFTGNESVSAWGSPYTHLFKVAVSVGQNTNNVRNLILSGYTPYGFTTHNYNTENMIYTTSAVDFVINDVSCTTGSQLLDNIRGKTVFFELANPIEYTLDEELNLNYRVDDFGTEQLLPENTSVPVTAPMVAQIAYAMNAVDTLRNLDKNFTNLATLDGLIAIINSKCGVNIVRGNFDSANNKYTFS